METPKIFAGYRALGFVSNHVPLDVRYHQKHKENYIFTCVGKAFHTYNCSRLGIISVSESHPAEISCLAVDGPHVFTGCQNVIRMFLHGRHVWHTLEGHKKEVHLLLPFGKHLMSVDMDSNIIIWDIESQGIYLELSFDNSSFQISTLMHPATYVNKVLIGSKQGTLQLWNIKANKLVYTFSGWGVPVTVTEQAPALDVVAIGLADGQIILHNLKYDETVTKFWQEWGPVTTISFRTDGHPIMVTGSALGHIALWDLEERKLRSQMLSAHSSAVSGMQCLPSEPLMVTSSPDNSLKVWIFDLPDGGGRLLRERSGHCAPPTRTRHYGSNGENILSSGQDSTLRSFSVVHDKHNKSLGRALFNKSQLGKSAAKKKDKNKMPPITHFAAEQCRQSDWDNIVACHRGLSEVSTWSYHRGTMGQRRLQHDRFTQEADCLKAVAQVVEISPCGNFALIGYSSGHVDMYNLQSGLYRGSYGTPSAHSCCVQGLNVDGLNQVTITTGRIGEIKFWRFKKKDLLETVNLQTTVSHTLLHRDSSMLAVARDDFQIDIIDIDTRRVVRKFKGHDSQITDMSYSPDARWLISSSMDCTIRTWDMPTGRLIDSFLVDSAVTSITMSPTGDFLATTHVDDLGVYLWSNMTLYSHVSLQPLPEDFQEQMVEMPSTSLSSEELQQLRDDVEETEVSMFKSREQISNELVTLSLLPSSRWQNLLNLDVIKQRNKPKQPPKLPKSAPFFLPTIPGLEPKFAPSEEEDKQDKVSSHVLGNLTQLSKLAQLLQEASISQVYTGVLDYMKSLGPSAVDVEIRSLGLQNDGSTQAMHSFLTFIKQSLKTNTDFEVIQSYLGLFLKLHGDEVSGHPELAEQLASVAEVQDESWRRVQNLLNSSLCLVQYLRTSTL